MRLFTLVAGYFAGLAIAMKYRNNTGISKLKSIDPTKSKLDTFIEEIIDIHRTAYSDVKEFAKDNFDDIDNFEDLQKKISGMVSDFSGTLEGHMEDAKEIGITKKDELLKIAQAFYARNESKLLSAKHKAASFSGIPESTIDGWLLEAQKQLKIAYSNIQSTFADKTPTEDIPVRKSTPKTTPTKFTKG